MAVATKPSQAVKIIRALKLAGGRGITSRDMVGMGIFKYSSRIAELRRDGWNIEATHVKGSMWKYHLIPEREYSHE